MVKDEVQTCDIHQLFSRMRSAAFDAIPEERISIGIPEYVPPIVVGQDAERWMTLASKLILSWARREAAIAVTVHYEDHHDPTDSCIVFSIRAGQASAQRSAECACEWLEELGTLRDELLVRSIALSFHDLGDSLVFDFRMPVHHCGARRRVHRDTVLLVEDDGYVLRAAREVLELSGYRVIAEGTAEDALFACEEHRDSICLVISDITLPAQDGRQLAQAVHASMPDIPVLLISGYSAMDCEDPMRRVYFLAKPFNGAALLGAAKRCLSAREGVFVPAIAGLRPVEELATAWS